jgi:acyl-CoA synthetase (AMP-forming)/AMP-acid ligase II/thioesterase domain-containing protein/acyl carrier protein
MPANHVLDVLKGNPTTGLFEILTGVWGQFSDKVLVKSEFNQYTGADLDRASSQVGRLLLEHLGDEPRPVPILLNQSDDMLLGLLGVMRSGHFYVILSNNNPPERLKQILANLEAPILLTNRAQEMFSSEIAPQDCKVVCIEDAWKLDKTPLDRQPAPDSVAAIYYTSGSTGEPKGVLRLQSVLVARGLDEVSRNELTQADNIALLYPLSTPASITTMLPAIFAGCTIVLYDMPAHGLTALNHTLLKDEITILRIPVELLRSWISTLEPGTFFPKIRAINSAGDVLYRRDVERLSQFVPENAEVVHHLSGSESGLLAHNVFPVRNPPDGEIIPVGFPSPERDIVLLDENYAPVPAGEIGEICARVGVHFPGYWKRPDLTKTKFVQDPLEPSRKIYCSGDLGRFRPDGRLEFIGRKDARVKIRGYSIDMAAIESVLTTMPEVRRAVVKPIQATGMQKRLAAYIVLDSGEQLTGRDFRSYLASRLPAYMIPAYFTILDELPLTVTGKVNRQALPNPDLAREQRLMPYRPPRDSFEADLAKIWEAEFRIPQIGLDDGFFELGGDSLTAARLFVAIEKRFGQYYPSSILLEHSSLEKLAAYLREHEASGVISPLQTSGSKKPIFILPGSYDPLFIFRNMLPYFDPERPVYGFELARVYRQVEGATNISELVKDLVAALKEFQPQGPYHILGFSSGGFLAFELACQLERAGDSVGLLALLDTSAPGKSLFDKFLPLALKYHLPNLRSLDWDGRRNYIRQRIPRLWVRFFSTALLRPFSRKALGTNVQLVNIVSKAFKPTRFNGDMLLFSAENRKLDASEDRASAWGEHLAGKLTIVPIPGEHKDLMSDPYVKPWAAKLSEAIVSLP